MKLPEQIDVEKIKAGLMEKDLLLSIKNSDDMIRVACFLHDLLDEFVVIYEDEMSTDPFAEISESQYKPLYRMFRQILRRSPAFHYSEHNFWDLNRHTEALVAGLLQIAAIDKFKDFRDKTNK